MYGFERPLLPAPLAGLRVRTLALPGLANNVGETVAVTVRTFPLLSRVTTVGMVFPFHWTTVFATKPVPITFSVMEAQLAALQALVWAGEREEIKAPVLF